MRCRLCNWLCDRFCGPAYESSDFWEISRRWESNHSNDWELWDSDSEEAHNGNNLARAVYAHDKAMAFATYKSLADNGSVWAMRQAGKVLEHGLGVERNLELAEKYYYKALLAGSWMATLDLAALLFENKVNDKWRGILENGVESDFVPACFWLGYYLSKGAGRKRMITEVKPLMERAAVSGHPGARKMLARWKLLGRFGLGEIANGFREFGALIEDFAKDRLLDNAVQTPISASA